ncbi:MAG TPA: class I SAM-dependent methyltransferase [Bacteroidales bacterium]|nr:class I SAM-dependent methyltransferase [Bacteroidales bacterium]
MLHHNSCQVCGSKDIVLLHTCTDHLVTGADFDIFTCRTCGFRFTQDIPDEADSGKYYESPEYISHTDSKKTIFERIYQVVRGYMLGRKKKLTLVSTSMAKGNLLDIGSGTGHFLETMNRSGWDVTGIEVSTSARDYSAGKFGLKVFGPGHIHNLPDGHFDCITMWHVAEHIYDIKGYFSEAARMLRPGGKMVIALPNCDSFDAVHYSKDWAAWDVPRHLWHFSPLVFRSFLNENGFRLIEERILPFDVFYISILSEKQRGSKPGFVTGMIKGLYFSFLSFFNRGRASSLVYIACKGPDQ